MNRRRAARALFKRRNDAVRKARVECVRCGGRLKVEAISQDEKWITAHCPHCGADLPLRPYNKPRMDPAAIHARARRAVIDRAMMMVFWTAVIVASAILLMETVRR